MAELNGLPIGSGTLQTLALVNYGHFTSMRVEDRAVRGLSLHLDRLARDCKKTFDVEMDRSQVREYIRRVAAATSAEVVNLRVTVFDPELEMGSPGGEAKPQFLVTCRAASSSTALPPISVRPARYTRENPSVKHIGLCGTIGLRRNAQMAGYDDVLFHEADERISEGATWNVGFFDGERVVWPDADVLDGVTMALVRRAHPDFAIEAVTLGSLGRMRAAFATNVSIGVRPISAIGDVKFDAHHPVLAEIRAGYTSIQPDKI